MASSGRAEMEKNTGILFVAVGFAVALVGAGLASICTPAPSGFCLPTPFSGVGFAAALMGGALFLVGILLILKTEGIPRPPVMPANAAPPVLCQVCGKPLAWIPTAARWFCSKCDVYR
jgi:hypothetical protein